MRFYSYIFSSILTTGTFCFSFAQAVKHQPKRYSEEVHQVSPGTIQAKISWLSFGENESVCSVNKPEIATVKIVEILDLGSGLTNVPNKKDTLIIEMRRTAKTARPEKLKEEIYTLKENLCFTSNDSYYSVFIKKQD